MRADAGRCDEYPVLTMYLMRRAAWLAQPFGSTYQRFFEANALLLAALALVVAGPCTARSAIGRCSSRSRPPC